MITMVSRPGCVRTAHDRLTAGQCQREFRIVSEQIDVDVSGILRREMTIPQAGDALIEMVPRTASGRLTGAEAFGYREFVLTKLYRSARGGWLGTAAMVYGLSFP